MSKRQMRTAVVPTPGPLPEPVQTTTPEPPKPEDTIKIWRCTAEAPPKSGQDRTVEVVHVLAQNTADLFARFAARGGINERTDKVTVELIGPAYPPTPMALLDRATKLAAKN